MVGRMKKSQKIQLPPKGGSNFIVDTVTLPVFGVPRLVYWVAKKLLEVAEQETMDEGKLQGNLLELQTKYELGEINEDEYTRQEAVLLDRLNAIHSAKEERQSRD